MIDRDDKGPPWTPHRLLKDPKARAQAREEAITEAMADHPGLTRAEAIEMLNAAGFDEVGDA